MFSSLPLGYNHHIFTTPHFINSMIHASQFRMTTCEYTCEEREIFEKTFESFAGCNIFTKFHYACTGSLAVEQAVKAAMIYSEKENPIIEKKSKSFHGITSFGNLLTGRTPATTFRFEGLPGEGVWPQFNTIEDLGKILKENSNVAGVIMEPIQSTNGDIYYDQKFFDGLRDLTTKYKVPLIFDEIQTGFGTTGKTWYFQYLGIVPDIVVFGKKSQVCGFMTTAKFGKIFETPAKMCITWDGDLADMIRSTYVIKAIKDEDLITNAENIGYLIANKLDDFKIKTRHKGLMIAFDLESKEKRDKFYLRLKKCGMLCNPTGERSIRLRPHLATTVSEATLGVKLIHEVYASL